jgi:uncharacterized protein YfiM (DUF2279 family)
MRLFILGLFLVCVQILHAQILHINTLSYDSVNNIALEKPKAWSAMENRLLKPTLSTPQIKRRVNAMKVAYPIMYGGILGSLSVAWYGQYQREPLHSFNDYKEWKQVDKLGHLYGTYIFSKAAIELWRSTGVSEKKKLWIGGMSGMVFQSIVEVFDGYSAEWGFSWGDMGANALGTTLLMAQEAAWNNQRIELKMGFSPVKYDASVKSRVAQIYGTNALEQFVKDYNAQTIWLSANVHDFFKNTKLPKWLNIAVGYGANGMLGADNNIWKDKLGNTINRSDIKRIRQFYLAPDLKLTKIKVRKKWQRVGLTVLNAFKFPMPALELNGNGKLVFHLIKF